MAQPSLSSPCTGEPDNFLVVPSLYLSLVVRSITTVTAPVTASLPQFPYALLHHYIHTEGQKPKLQAAFTDHLTLTVSGMTVKTPRCFVPSRGTFHEALKSDRNITTVSCVLTETRLHVLNSYFLKSKYSLFCIHPTIKSYEFQCAFLFF